VLSADITDQTRALAVCDTNAIAILRQKIVD
jgi:hypothetical protein